MPVLHLSFCESRIWGQLSWVFCLGCHRMYSGYQPRLGSHQRLAQSRSCRISFRVAVGFMAAHFFKAKNGEKRGWGRETPAKALLSSYVIPYVITHIPSPLPYSTAQKHITDPTHTQGKELTRRHEQQGVGVMVGTSLKPELLSVQSNHVHKERMKNFSRVPGTQRTYSDLLTVLVFSI